MAQLLQMLPDGSGVVLTDAGEQITVPAGELPAALAGVQTPSQSLGNAIGMGVGAMLGNEPQGAPEDADAALADQVATAAAAEDPRGLERPTRVDASAGESIQRAAAEQTVPYGAGGYAVRDGVDQGIVTSGNVGRTDADLEVDAMLGQISDPYLRGQLARKLGRPLVPDLPQQGLGDQQVEQLASMPSIEGGTIMRMGTPSGSYEMVRDPLARIEQRNEAQMAGDLAQLETPIDFGGGAVPTDEELLELLGLPPRDTFAADVADRETLSQQALDYAKGGARDEQATARPRRRRRAPPRGGLSGSVADPALPPEIDAGTGEPMDLVVPEDGGAAPSSGAGVENLIPSWAEADPLGFDTRVPRVVADWAPEVDAGTGEPMTLTLDDRQPERFDMMADAEVPGDMTRSPGLRAAITEARDEERLRLMEDLGRQGEMGPMVRRDLHEALRGDERVQAAEERSLSRRRSDGELTAATEEADFREREMARASRDRAAGIPTDVRDRRLFDRSSLEDALVTEEDLAEDVRNSVRRRARAIRPIEIDMDTKRGQS